MRIWTLMQKWVIKMMVVNFLSFAKFCHFFDKKMAKLVETQKFHHYRLDHSFLHQGSYSHFLIWWIFRKLAFYHLFWGISNEKIYVTPLVGTGKNYSYLVLQHIKNCYAKMSLVFQINQKNRQNEGVFGVAVMEWSKCIN